MKVSDMKCRVCGLGPNQDVSLYRQKDQVGGWACEAHNETSIDEDVQELVATLESNGQTKQ